MSDEPDLLREPPLAGTETETLLGSLERQRLTFAWKCADLSDDAVRFTIGVSTLTIGGLQKHLALVEDQQFGDRLLGESFGPPWDRYFDSDDPDWHLKVLPDDDAAGLTQVWLDAVERSRARVDRVLAGDGLDALAPPVEDGRRPSLRRLLVDMVEEYARHTGHVDLIRESIDGRVGEDPPADWDFRRSS